MQFIDLSAQYHRIKNKVDERIISVLDSGRYIMGPEVSELEKRLAEYTGVKHVISCSSGTDALLMPLMAWGIGPGDAVFTSTFTFFATAEVISFLGAIPVFVDVEPDTFNISPEKLEQAIIKIRDNSTLNPKAIIPVDIFGVPADYNAIAQIAEKYGLLVMEDAAQSFGATYDGKKACSFGNVATTSFYPAKPLGCYGDGGAIFTNDDELKDILESIRVHGQGSDKYENVRIGINGRLDTIQAAILLEKLAIFDNEMVARQHVAEKYRELLSDKIQIQTIPDNIASAYAQYTLLAESAEHKETIIKRLKESDIPITIYYPIPMHRQKAFEHMRYNPAYYEIAESISPRVFSIPFHPYLTDDEIKFISEKIY